MSFVCPCSFHRQYIASLSLSNHIVNHEKRDEILPEKAPIDTNPVHFPKHPRPRSAVSDSSCGAGVTKNDHDGCYGCGDGQ